LARRAFAAFPGATQIGLDVIASDFRADAFADNAAIVEVNRDPMIAMAPFAAYGPPATEIAAQLIDFAAGNRLDRVGPATGRLDPAPRFEAVTGADPYPRSDRLQARLLREAAARRGLAVEALNADLTLVSGQGRQHLYCFGIPDTTLQAARRASNDKEKTKRLLRAAGLATPAGRSFAPGEMETAWRYAVELGLPVVLKPFTGSGG